MTIMRAAIRLSMHADVDLLTSVWQMQANKRMKIKQGSPHEQVALAHHITSLAVSPEDCSCIGQLTELLILLGETLALPDFAPAPHVRLVATQSPVLSFHFCMQIAFCAFLKHRIGFPGKAWSCTCSYGVSESFARSSPISWPLARSSRLCRRHLDVFCLSGLAQNKS